MIKIKANVDIALLRRIQMIISSEGYFNSDNYDINISFKETKKFSTLISRPTHNEREIIIKYPKVVENKGFYDYLVKYLQEEYNFNLWKYAKSTSIPQIEVYMLFSILHEFGHTIEYIDRINKQGDYPDRYEVIELSKYWEVSKIVDITDRFYAYRRLEKEALADKIAIDLMETFKKKFSFLFGVIK